jgi:hypothetical protein
MSKCTSDKIAAISMVRNGGFFVEKWIDYYGRLLGPQNLYLIIDGLDQPLPVEHEGINITQVPHITQGKSAGDRYRAKLVSEYAKTLFKDKGYKVVVAHDIDEFLVLDPSWSANLTGYLLKLGSRASISALGVDVVHHPNNEKALDPQRLFMSQRSYAVISARYTKPVVATEPVMWGPGFQRVRGKQFNIDPNLFLFHFGMVDIDTALNKVKERDRKRCGWRSHFRRREAIFELVKKKQPLDGDIVFSRARLNQTIFRPFFIWNKKTMIFKKTVIRVPDRFKNSI